MLLSDVLWWTDSWAPFTIGVEGARALAVVAFKRQLLWYQTG